jgi:hypothetical protein
VNSIEVSIRFFGHENHRVQEIGTILLDVWVPLKRLEGHSRDKHSGNSAILHFSHPLSSSYSLSCSSTIIVLEPHHDTDEIVIFVESVRIGKGTCALLEISFLFSLLNASVTMDWESGFTVPICSQTSLSRSKKCQEDWQSDKV